MTVFLRVLEPSVEQKPEALLGAVRSVSRAASSPSDVQVFDLSPTAFRTVPGSPFAYWVSEGVRSIFGRETPFVAGGRIAAVGIQTSDDFRFLRASWEVASRDFVPIAKGGRFSQFYADTYLCVAWRANGRELKSSVEARYGTASKHIQNQRLYYRAGLTWPSRTNGLSLRVLTPGCVFGHKGPTAFVPQDSPVELLALSAVMNSAAFGYLVSVQLARTELAQSYEVGLIQQTPLPNLSGEQTKTMAGLARRAWSLKRTIDSLTETSHAFLLPPGLAEQRAKIEQADIEQQLAPLQQTIDETAFGLYDIASAERAAIEAAFGKRTNSSTTSQESDPQEDDAEDEDGEPTSVGPDALTSWLVGVAFGRFDPRLATGERPIPPEPEPFDPLPFRSPGMYPEGEDPADRPDILVDDEGHADDLAARATAIAERVKVDAPEDLRVWLAKAFFQLHIKMYSRSRRKAPIYWQLATPSAGYSVWLHIHAFSKDTLFRVQNDYVAPKLAHEERRLESLTSELRDGATAAQRKQLASQESVVEELRAFLDEVKRVAPLWKPNLDDGVIINFAPLWRLVPQNKAWQKELKSTWDALADGKYDWAHLAMHLWPERVVPKCAKDRSLAIAHGLEDVFWVEGTDGRWTARKTPTKSADELVKERTSPAVKSALKSLLEAPVASGKSTGRKGGGRRKAADATEGGDA